MTTASRKKARPTYNEILGAARELSPADRRRLHDELARLVGVQLVRPATTSTAIRRGRRLAKAIRAELARAPQASLEDVMRDVRGRQ
jgi:hypothetical protein